MGKREDSTGSGEGPSGDAERAAPRIVASRAGPSPHAVVVPEAGAAVHRAEHCADDAGAAAGHEIDLDPRLVQRPQHASLIRAGSPDPDSTSAVLSRVEYCRSGDSGVITMLNAEAPRYPASTFVVDGLELDDFETFAAIWRGDRYLVTFLLREERPADGRCRRDEALARRPRLPASRANTRRYCRWASLRWTVEPKPTLSWGSLSRFISEMSLTRFCSRLIRASTRR